MTATMLRDVPTWEALRDLYGQVAHDDQARELVTAEAARRERSERQRGQWSALRSEWENAAHGQMIAASHECRGRLVDTSKAPAWVTDWHLWTCTPTQAERWASEELRGYFADHPRVGLGDYRGRIASGKRQQLDERDAAALDEPTEEESIDDGMDADERDRVRFDARADQQSAEVRGVGAGHIVPPAAARGEAQDRGVAGAAARPGIPVPGMTMEEKMTARIAELKEQGRERAAAMRAQVAVRGEVAVRRPEISGEDVLGYCETLLRRHCRLPSQAAADAMVLWAAHTHMRDAEGVLVWQATPRMMFLSSEPGSGKSRALELLGWLCPNTYGLDTEPTAAGLAWTLSSEHATGLIDEADVLFGAGKRKESVRAILNAGCYRNGTVLRMRGSKGVRQRVFGPVAIAGLDVMKTATGESLAPLFSRAIVVRMRKSAEAVPAIDASSQAVAAKLRTALSLWAASVRDSLAQAAPELPDWLMNRQAEIWTPLISLADAAGGDWPARARAAAEELARFADLEDAGDDDVLADLAALTAGWE